MLLPLLCKSSGTIYLMQPGLMAGWHTDKFILKFTIDQNFKLIAVFSKVTVQMHSSQ